MSTPETPGHPGRILRDGLAQAVSLNAPPEVILRLKCAVFEAALNEIIKTGGHAAILAQNALTDTLEPKQ